MVLARRASYSKKTLARQVIPLAPGYRTALSSRPETSFDSNFFALNMEQFEELLSVVQFAFCLHHHNTHKPE